jgi:hypothetical protein
MPNYHTTSEGNVPFTAEEELQWAAEQAAWIAGTNTRKAVVVRAERDAKLSETDWRFRSDMTPSQAWKDYCQALRDVPTQAGFPWSIEWPDAP